MVLIYLSTLLFSLSSFSQAHHQCLHNADGMIDCSSADKHLEGGFPQDVLEWWAAKKNKVAGAKCNNPKTVSEQEILSYINRNKEHKKTNDSFYGISLEDEDPHLIELLKKLTQFDGMWNFFDEQKNLDSQKTFDIPEDCKKVLCAAKSIFGEKQAPKLLYLMDKYELNLSHVTDDNITAFKDKQIDTILEAVDDLPSHLMPFEKNQYFKHYKNGYGPSDTTIANATITFYDPWDNQDSSEMRMYTVIHEIGHNIGSRLNQDEDPEWLNLTGWFELDGKWTSAKDDQQVSKYGATNPAEDFAEAFSGYRYDPERLKAISPKKYEYMKNKVFLGIEYTSEEKCANENSLLAKLKKTIDIVQSEIPQKYSLCEKELEGIILKKETNLKACIEKMKFMNEMDKKLEGKSSHEIDAIKKAMSFEEFKGESISKEEEIAAYKMIIGDIFGSIQKEYWDYSGDCSSAKDYGNQDFHLFNEYTFNEQFNDITNPNDLNSMMFDICSRSEKKKFECSDLVPFMQEYMPEKFEYKIDSSKVKKTTETEPNDFRCVID